MKCHFAIAPTGRFAQRREHKMKGARAGRSHAARWSADMRT